jgi:hypothetical protein
MGSDDDSDAAAVEQPSLDGCREKQRRGLKHLRDLDSAIADWLGEPGVEPSPYRLSGEFRPESGEYVFTGELLKRSDEAELLWGVILGDALHNLRSALDHLVAQLVLLNTGKRSTSANAFPICDTRATYLSIGKKGEPSKRDTALRGVSDTHKALIDEMQPYRTRIPPGALHPLSTLRDLSNRDKHRLVHLTDFAVDFRAREQLEDLFIPNVDAGEPLGARFAPMRYGQETEILGVKFSCPGPEPDVKVKGHPPLNIGMSESRARLEHIRALGDDVGDMIEVFATDFSV